MRNGRKDVLLVCWGNHIEIEWRIAQLLENKYNLYIKPHPGEKENPEYKRMVQECGCIIIPKDAYPRVDVVLSYESTLADEYADAGIKVIRYDLMERIEDIIGIIE